MNKWVPRTLAVMAMAYPLLLLLLIVLLRFVGEAWWVTDVGLYLPRLPLALPLPFLALALWLWGRRRLLVTQLVAAVLLLFPLMGLVLPWPARVRADSPRVRVLSYNVNSAYGGLDRILEEVDRFGPDVVLLQELFSNGEAAAARLRDRYPVVQLSTQFLVATRFPILSATEP